MYLCGLELNNTMQKRPAESRGGIGMGFESSNRTKGQNNTILQHQMLLFTWRALFHGRPGRLPVFCPLSEPGPELSHPPDHHVRCSLGRRLDASTVNTEQLSYTNVTTAHVCSRVCEQLWAAPVWWWSRWWDGGCAHWGCSVRWRSRCGRAGPVGCWLSAAPGLAPSRQTGMGRRRSRWNRMLWPSAPPPVQHDLRANISLQPWMKSLQFFYY